MFENTIEKLMDGSWRILTTICLPSLDCKRERLGVDDTEVCSVVKNHREVHLLEIVDFFPRTID